MTKARTILYLKESITDRYRVELKVYGVDRSKKYPDGFKVSFALIDLESNQLRVLIDNHAPYGFHFHEGLPDDKNLREKVNISNYFEALDEFWIRANRIIYDQN